MKLASVGLFSIAIVMSKEVLKKCGVEVWCLLNGYVRKIRIRSDLKYCGWVLVLQMNIWTTCLKIVLEALCLESQSLQKHFWKSKFGRCAYKCSRIACMLGWRAGFLGRGQWIFSENGYFPKSDILRK